VIAVSAGMRADVLAAYRAVDPDRVVVVHNGIDTDEYRPVPSTGVLERLGIDESEPYALFVGRITRQKGLVHLLRAAHLLPAGVQLVLCASAPDEPTVAAEVAAEIDRLRARRSGVLWFAEPLSRAQLVTVLSGATVFACPSVYEPLGIVNLEAMACGTAVVAGAVGGIPEVVDDGTTGLLVPYDAADPAAFETALGDALGQLVDDPDRAAGLGVAGRRRAEEEFGWPTVARRTLEVYRSVLAHR
jgi:starch synthase